MNKKIRNIIGFSYVALILIGLFSFGCQIEGILKIIWITLVSLLTIEFLFILREEEDEEIKGD